MPFLDPFKGAPVNVTVKLDGENTTLYRDGLHARSTTYSPHPSRNWLRAAHAKIADKIPFGWRVCGENMFAKHSIHYKNLDSFFYVHSVWNADGVCLPPADTRLLAAILGFPTPPIIYAGPGDRRFIEHLYRQTFNYDPCEGYVVRVDAEILPYAFGSRVGKYVRANHVQTDNNWIRGKVIKNELKAFVEGQT